MNNFIESFGKNIIFDEVDDVNYSYDKNHEIMRIRIKSISKVGYETLKILCSTLDKSGIKILMHSDRPDLSILCVLENLWSENECISY